MVECSKWDLLGHPVRKVEDNSNESSMDCRWSYPEHSEGSNISNWTVHISCDILVDLCPSPKNLSEAILDKFGANFIGRGDFKAGCNWLCGLVTSG